MLRKRDGRSGFTIVELLVVVTIMIILASLLLTMTTRAEQRANTLHCMSNLQQVGKALLAYVNGMGGGFLPNFGVDPSDPRVADQWVWQLDFFPPEERVLGRQAGINSEITDAVLPPRMAPQVLICPSDPHLFTNGQAVMTSYWMHPANSYRFYSDITRRTGTPIGFEGDAINQTGGCGCRFHMMVYPDEIDPNHDGGGHMLFADGTVKLIKDDPTTTVNERKVSSWWKWKCPHNCKFEDIEKPIGDECPRCGGKI